METGEKLVTKVAAALLAVGLALFWFTHALVDASHTLAAVHEYATLGARIGLIASALVATVGIFAEGLAQARRGYNLLIAICSIVCLALQLLPELGLPAGLALAIGAGLLIAFLATLSQRFFAPFVALGISYVLAFYLLPELVVWLSASSAWLAAVPSLLVVAAGLTALVPSGGQAAQTADAS